MEKNLNVNLFKLVLTDSTGRSVRFFSRLIPAIEFARYLESKYPCAIIAIYDFNKVSSDGEIYFNNSPIYDNLHDGCYAKNYTIWFHRL